MPFLRGSIKPSYKIHGLSSGRPASISTKLRRLERKVNQQRPEIRYFQENINHSSGVASGVYTDDQSVTSYMVAASPFFRDNVSGDKWKNLSLLIKAASETSSLDRMRIQVYVPVRPGSTASTVTNTPADFTIQQDPSDIKLLYDRTWDATGFDGFITPTVFVKLGFESVLNSSSGILEKGNIRVRITYETNVGSLSPAMRWSMKLAFHDK